MRNWFTKEFIKVSAVLLIVFLAGAGTGYVGGRKHAHYEFLQAEQRTMGGLHASQVRSLKHGTRSFRARGERRFIRRLEHDLNLNSAQRANVDRALQNHYERIREIRSRMRPQINSIMQEIRNDVRSFLDDEQKISFDQMVEKHKKRREMRRQRRIERAKKIRPDTSVSPAMKP